MNEVSMVIAAYNAEKTLRATIESVINQKHPPSEIVFVNDGSEDGTGDVINGYAKNSEIPFRLVSLKVNGGVSRARNIGVAHASCPYIAFCDSDDILEVEHLLLLNELRSICPDSVVWFGNERIVDEEGRVRLESIQLRRTFKLLEIDKVANDSFGGVCNNISGRFISSMVEGSFIPVSGCMIRRSAFDEIGGFNENLRSSEDLNLFLKLSLVGRFSFTTSFVSNKLEHSGNITAVTRQKIGFLSSESCIGKSLGISISSAKSLIDFIDFKQALLQKEDVDVILKQLHDIQISCYYFSSKISMKNLLAVVDEFSGNPYATTKPSVRDFFRACFYGGCRKISQVISS